MSVNILDIRGIYSFLIILLIFVKSCSSIEIWKLLLYDFAKEKVPVFL